jgi:hypothetical protein
MKNTRQALFFLFFLVAQAFCQIAAQDEPLQFVMRPGENIGPDAPFLPDPKVPDRYAPQKLFDDSLETCWAIGDGGPGVEIFLAVPDNLSAMEIFNGFAKSKDLFDKNNRVKDIKARLFAAFSLPAMITETDARGYELYPVSDVLRLHLRDTLSRQRIELPFNWAVILNRYANIRMSLPEEPVLEGYYLQIEIVDVYKGSKWNDTCVSEISWIPSSKPIQLAKKAYTNKDGSALLIDTETEKAVVLVKDSSRVMSIEGSSSDLRWLIVQSTPIKMGGFGEPTYELYNTLLRTKIDPEAYGYRPIELLDWVEENGKIILAEGGERWPIDLDEIFTEAARTCFDLRIGSGEYDLGGGLVEKRYSDAVVINVMPSMAARSGKIYICDAINFRLLVFDYRGNFLKQIRYPQQHPDGSPFVAEYLAVTDERLFLLSWFPTTVYELDESGAVLNRITGAETKEKRLRNVAHIGFSKSDTLLIPDTWENKLYIYIRKGQSWTLATTEPYSSSEQLYLDSKNAGYRLIPSKSPSGFDLHRWKNGKLEKLCALEHHTELSVAQLIGIDAQDRLYIAVVDAGEHPGAEQEAASAYIKVLSRDGELLSSIDAGRWTAGTAISPYIVVDENGFMFQGEFVSEDPESGPDDPPTMFVVRALNRG